MEVGSTLLKLGAKGLTSQCTNRYVNGVVNTQISNEFTVRAKKEQAKSAIRQPTESGYTHVTTALPVQPIT